MRDGPDGPRSRAPRGGAKAAALEEFLDFVRGQAHIFSTYPNLMFQQAGNAPPATEPAKIAGARWAAELENRPWLKELKPPGTEQSFKLLTLPAHQGTVNGCVFDLEGKTLVSVGDDGRICFWEVATGRLRWQVSLPDRRVLCCAFDSRCEKLATGDDQGEVTIWEPETGARLATFHSGRASGAAERPDPRYPPGSCVVACCFVTGQDQLVVVLAQQSVPLLGYAMPRVWRYVASERWSCEGNYLGSVSYLSTGGQAVDGKRLIQNDIMPQITAFDIELQEQTKIDLGPREFLLFGDTISWDQALVARDAPDTTDPGRSPALYRFDRDACKTVGAPLVVLDPHAEPLSITRFSSDNRLLATGARDGVVAVWHVPGALGRGSEVPEGAPPSPLEVVNVGFSPDGQHVAWLQSGETLEFGLLSRQTLSTLQPAISQRVHSHWATCLRYSPDGRTILTGGFDHTVRSWNAESLQEETHLTVGDLVRGISVRADGRRIAVVHHGDLFPDYPAGVSVFEWPTGQHLHTVAGRWSACEFTGDGKQLLLAGADLRFVDADNGVTRRRAPHEGQALTYACLNRAETLVAFMTQSELLLWDVPEDAVFPMRLPGDATPTRCAFSPDGACCVVTSGEGQAYLLDTAGFVIFGTWCTLDPLTCCDFHPKEALLALGSEHGRKTLLQICRRS